MTSALTIIVRFFSPCNTQITTWRHPFSVDRRHKREFAARTEVDSGKCVIIRWHKCIISEGVYFDGDEINLDK